MREFPRPSALLTESPLPIFRPAHEVREWAIETFVAPDGSLVNEDHEHLQDADILFLWASYSETRDLRTVVGTAELNRKQEKRWTQGREFAFFREHNREVDPDFVITLSAPFFAEADPTSICAVVEHELYHCAQDRDEFGMLRWNRDGSRKWGIRGHDVEEFHGIVARYGAYNEGLRAFRDALNLPPVIAREMSHNAVCGCGSRLA